jgi:SAM-dependent methyltransferase
MVPSMPHEAIHADVERYYSGKFAEHGPSAKGVDWNSEESQELRFEQLARLFSSPQHGFSVNDVGCGYGAFAAFLVERGYDASYTGYDLSRSMVEHARASFGDSPRVRFEQGSSLSTADYSVASGIFNVKLGFAEDDWVAYVWQTIDAIARASRHGFAFNMLTLYSDPDKRRSDLYYADPGDTLNACAARYGRHVALLHDYGLWEFTVIVRFPE